MSIPRPTHWLSLSTASVQACRGEEYDNAVTGMAGGDSVPEENQVVMNAGVVHTLPAGADFLMCYSVAEGETA